MAKDPYASWEKIKYNYGMHVCSADMTVQPSHNILRTVPTNSQVILRSLLNMREKQIITSVIEIQKENLG